MSSVCSPKRFSFLGMLLQYLLTYVYSYKLFTLDSFLHYMLPQRSKAHMHTPIRIFFTCIAKKQISKLHNIVLLHKKVEPLNMYLERYNYALKFLDRHSIDPMFTFDQLLWKKSIYLPLYYIFFSFSN